MRVLITGGTGLLGRSLIATRPPWVAFVATVRRAVGDPSPLPCTIRELDVTDRAGVAVRQAEGGGRATGARQRIPCLLMCPILMYGWNHPRGRLNPVTWLMARLGQGERVRVVDDVFSNPLFADHCARAIWRTIELDQRGCFHLAGSQCLNHYEFARITARVLGLSDSLIAPASSVAFSEIAPRPPNTCYRTEKTERVLGMRPLSVEEELRWMKGVHDRRRS